MCHGLTGSGENVPHEIPPAEGAGDRILAALIGKLLSASHWDIEPWVARFKVISLCSLHNSVFCTGRLATRPVATR